MKPQLSISSRIISGLIVVLNLVALLAPVSAFQGRGMVSPALHEYFWSGIFVSPNVLALLGAFSLVLSLSVHAVRIACRGRLPFWLILTALICHIASRNLFDYHWVTLCMHFSPHYDLWIKLVVAGAIASCLSVLLQLFLVCSAVATRGATAQKRYSEQAFTIRANHVGVSLAIIAGLIAILQWWHIGYRFHEFRTFYHSELGMNHIDDSRFLFIHLVNLSLLGLGSLVVWSFRGRRLGERVIVCTPFIVNLLGWFTILGMKHAGVLVPLSEFMKNLKGG